MPRQLGRLAAESLVMAGALCLARPAAAQEPARLAALRDTVATADTGALGTLLAAASAQRTSEAERQARRGWILLREGELSSGRELLDRAIAAFDESILREHNWADTWVGLAQAKLLLAEREQPVMRSLHQPNGEYYDDAALSHLARALSIDAENPTAVRLLTSLLIDREGLPLTGALADAVKRAAGDSANGPFPHLFVARDARLADRLDQARQELGSFLRLGGDSGLADLELARTEYRARDTVQAVNTYLAGAGRLDSLSRAAYRRDLAWTARPEEMAAFDSLGPAEVGDWITRFWARRDAEAVQAPGTALREHFRRWFYVLDRFHTVGRERGISKLGIRYGESAAGLDGGDNAYLGLTETTTYRDSPRRALGVDDRGLIYLRFGEPTMRASSMSESGAEEGCLVANESWRYDLPTGPRIFHFCASLALGVSAPTTLVPMLPLVEGLLDSRLAMEPKLAELAFAIHQAEFKNKWQSQAVQAQNAQNLDDSSTDQNGPGHYQVNGSLSRVLVANIAPEVVQRYIDEGRANARTALESNSYARSYGHDLEPTIQVYGLGRNPRAGGTALVVFALPGDKLEPREMSGRVVYPVHIRLTAVDTVQHFITNSDTTRLFVTRDTLTTGTFLYGVASIPLGPGRYYVRALFDQPATSAGGAAGRSDVTIPADGPGPTLSDLIPGRAGGLSYTHGGDPIPLNPLGVFKRSDAMQVYYELHGAVPGQKYQTTVELAKLSGGKPSKSDRLSLNFTDRPDRPTWSTQRSLDLNRLDPGMYLLRVTVDDKTTRSLVVRVSE